MAGIYLLKVRGRECSDASVLCLLHQLFALACLVSCNSHHKGALLGDWQDRTPQEDCVASQTPPRRWQPNDCPVVGHGMSSTLSGEEENGQVRFSVYKELIQNIIFSYWHFFFYSCCYSSTLLGSSCVVSPVTEEEECLERAMTPSQAHFCESSE